MKKTVYAIIGANTAGLAAAAHLRRQDQNCQITVFEKTFTTGYPGCGFPYHLTGEVQFELSLDVKYLSEIHDIEIRTGCEVIQVSSRERCLVYENREKIIEKFFFDRLIITSGASAVFDIPGSSQKGIFALRSSPDFTKIRDYLQKEKINKVLIIGAGYIGIESAFSLAEEKEVTILEKKGQILPAYDSEISDLIKRKFLKKGISLYTDTDIRSFESCDGQISAVCENRKKYTADMVIIAAGLKMNTDFLSADFRKTRTGQLIVNEYLQTSVSFAFAAGDIVCFEKNAGLWQPFAGQAVRQAKYAALNASGKSRRFSANIQPSVFSAGDFRAGICSRDYSSSAVKEMQSIYLVRSDRQPYISGGKAMYFKLDYHKKSGEIQKIQIYGGEGTERRLDVISAAIQRKGTVYELAELNLCYSPVSGFPQDAVNILGRIACNIRDFKCEVTGPSEFLKNRDRYFVIDVRTEEEFQKGKLSDAVNIPLETIKNASMPSGKKILLYCLTGERSYIAQRILQKRGIEAVNLLGGYLWASRLN